MATGDIGRVYIQAEQLKAQRRANRLGELSLANAERGAAQEDKLRSLMQENGGDKTAAYKSMANQYPLYAEQGLEALATQQQASQQQAVVDMGKQEKAFDGAVDELSQLYHDVEKHGGKEKAQAVAQQAQDRMKEMFNKAGIDTSNVPNAFDITVIDAYKKRQAIEFGKVDASKVTPESAAAADAANDRSLLKPSANQRSITAKNNASAAKTNAEAQGDPKSKVPLAAQRKNAEISTARQQVQDMLKDMSVDQIKEFVDSSTSKPPSDTLEINPKYSPKLAKLFDLAKTRMTGDDADYEQWIGLLRSVKKPNSESKNSISSRAKKSLPPGATLK